MPRTARVAPKEHVYHVLTRGNNRQAVFEDEEDFRKYLDILLRYKEKYNYRLYHYVLMNNHVHLVIEPSEPGGGLSEIMKGINWPMRMEDVAFDATLRYETEDTAKKIHELIKSGITPKPEYSKFFAD